MPEKKILICRPVSSPSFVLGSLPMKCHGCNKSVWVTPSSMILLHDNPAMIILCSACAYHIIKHEDEIQEFSPAQVEEIQEYLKSQ